MTGRVSPCTTRLMLHWHCGHCCTSLRGSQVCNRKMLWCIVELSVLVVCRKMHWCIVEISVLVVCRKMHWCVVELSVLVVCRKMHWCIVELSVLVVRDALLLGIWYLFCLLRLWVWIPPGAWMYVMSCALSGRGLCNALIMRPEEYYRLWCVVVCDLETSRMRRPWPTLGRSAMWGGGIFRTV